MTASAQCSVSARASEKSAEAFKTYSVLTPADYICRQHKWNEPNEASEIRDPPKVDDPPEVPPPGHA